MARSCLDYVRDQVQNRVDRETNTPWITDFRIQAAIARAEMELAAARASVYTSLEKQWQNILEGDEPASDYRVVTALARYNAFQTARNIVQSMYNLLGGSSVYRKSPLDRWLRDAQTMCQHAVAQDAILQLAGNVLVGGKSTNIFF
ncbi:Acyl-CoA dehydrogenase type 2 domain protein (fragment) [Xenorhabdus bovienii str. feltiae Moldova]|uniref:Acyl-CoA dehydrogenase type 2 domain protein n=2 Tax=Xenorhabdus bovienii TaxID=40576 RepID=A0A077NQ57_XENBV